MCAGDPAGAGLGQVVAAQLALRLLLRRGGRDGDRRPDLDQQRLGHCERLTDQTSGAVLLFCLLSGAHLSPLTSEDGVGRLTIVE